MKSFFISITFPVLYLCIMLSLTGCTKIEEQSINHSGSNGVSLAMVNDYLSRASDSDKTKSSSSTSVRPYISNRDTLMYIVDYGNQGWAILSGDVRTPAILAESHTGRLDFNDGNEAFVAWVECMAEDIRRVKNAADEDLTFSAAQIASHRAFWSNTPQRSIIPDSSEEEDGRWVGYGTTVTEPYDSIPHILSTRWHQGTPFNEYCPLKSIGDGRAPAGCVAIAGAQMLYFLHNRFSVPEQMVSEATCQGDINNYTMSQTNPTSTVWSSMNMNGGGSESVMIAKIGNLVGMDYDNDESRASASLLCTNVFEHYGLNCAYGSYDESRIRINLTYGKPLIVTAKSSASATSSLGHCFIIDGYKRTRDVTTTTYIWEGLNPEPHPDYTTTTYSSPEIAYVKMNWGWASQWGANHTNDGWFTLSGDWVCTLNGELQNFAFKRKLISDFQVSE